MQLLNELMAIVVVSDKLDDNSVLPEKDTEDINLGSAASRLRQKNTAITVEAKIIFFIK